MQTSRLSLSLANGTVTLPEAGRIAVLRPRLEADLSALPQDRVHVVQGFYPDHQAFAARGFDTGLTPSGEYGAAVVFLPRAKAEARALLAVATDLVNGGLVIVDGQKTDGIDSVFKDCRKHGAIVGPAYSKFHGKLFTMTGGGFSDWATVGGETITKDGFVTVPGVFSADGVDPGSAVLGAALPDKLSGKVADLGAGWGYLSRLILDHPGVKECHLFEAEHTALDCARRNISDPRASFHWADATNLSVPRDFDLVITNPPFHTARAAEPALGQAFIRSAAAILKPSGMLWLVANRHLPYEAALSNAFAEVSEVSGDAAFKVFRASKPHRRAE